MSYIQIYNDYPFINSTYWLQSIHELLIINSCKIKSQFWIEIINSIMISI